MSARILYSLLVMLDVKEVAYFSAFIFLYTVAVTVLANNRPTILYLYEYAVLLLFMISDYEWTWTIIMTCYSVIILQEQRPVMPVNLTKLQTLKKTENSHVN